MSYQMQRFWGNLIFVPILLIPPLIFAAVFGVLLGIVIYIVSVGTLVLVVRRGEMTGGLMAMIGPFFVMVFIIGGLAKLLSVEIALVVWFVLFVFFPALSLSKTHT